MLDESQVARELDQQIQDWCSQSPRNLSEMARRSGVPESTLRRISSSESLPNVENLLKICSTLAKSNDTRSFSGLVPDGVLKVLRYRLPMVDFGGKEDKYKHSLQQGNLDLVRACYSKCPESAAVFLMLEVTRKSKRSEIQGIFGVRKADFALELLTANGLIVNDGDDYITKTSEEKAHELSADRDLHFQASLILQAAIAKEKWEGNGSLLISGKLSPKGVLLFRESVIALMENLFNIAKEHPGDIPMMLGGSLESITVKVPNMSGKDNI